MMIPFCRVLSSTFQPVQQMSRYLFLGVVSPASPFFELILNYLKWKHPKTPRRGAHFKRIKKRLPQNAIRHASK
jgi:hypothetical protein